MQDTIDDSDASYPCYRISVARSGGATCTYIVQRPFLYSRSPIGRSTRAYIALDLAANELVFLKDYWRPCEQDPEERPPEAEVYVILENKKVRHLPHVRLAGDVPDAPNTAYVGAQENICFQSTVTQSWADKEGMCVCNPLREYCHHRIVQDLAFPLSTVKNSKELVAAIRNAVQCTSSWAS